MIDSLDIIALLSIEGVGRKTVNYILELYGSHSLTMNEVYEILKNKLTFISLECIINAYEKSKCILDYFEKANIHIIHYLSRDYPNSLKNISDPPMLLFIKGHYDFIYNEKECIAVVGTRKPSELGKNTSFLIARYLSKKNISVISGLAAGCDTQAHLGSLKENGRTAAVIAHGLNMIYPYENKKLFYDIIDKGGCIISEYLPNEKPKNYTFVERDRIQSGLSSGIIVIETEEIGGTMHTVRFAKQQTKKIGCVMYSFIQMKEPQKRGNKIILNDFNALAITNYQDIDRFIQ